MAWYSSYRSMPRQSGWVTTFFDDFNGANGASPDAAKWFNPEKDNNYPGATDASYQADDAYLDGLSHLVLRAQVRSAEGTSWTAGQVSTRNGFAQTYGRWEFVAQMPAGGQGIWPALWMYPVGVNWPPEIDVLEMVNDMTVWYTNYHWDPTTGQDLQSTTNAAYATGFHKFEVQWWPDRLEWYYDGTLIRTSTANIPNQAMGVMMGLQVGGVWPGVRPVTATFPQYMLIDSVRVSKWMG